MNELFVYFAEKNDIDVDALGESLRIYEENEINELVADYKIEGKEEKVTVSIAEIVGYDYGWRKMSNNLAVNFEHFFGYGSGYQTRSIGMLEYPSSEVLEKLSNSFMTEPIHVLEVDEGKKIISLNGIHRYTVLRLHYLNEMQKANGNKEREQEIADKYRIPVNLTKVDLIKTYCHFLIKSAYSNIIRVSKWYGQNWKETGKTEISIAGNKIIVTDEELINYTKKIILNIEESRISYFLECIEFYMTKYHSLKEFIDTYFIEEINFLRNEISKKGRSQ